MRISTAYMCGLVHFENFPGIDDATTVPADSPPPDVPLALVCIRDMPVRRLGVYHVPAAALGALDTAARFCRLFAVLVFHRLALLAAWRCAILSFGVAPAVAFAAAVVGAGGLFASPTTCMPRIEAAAQA